MNANATPDNPVQPAAGQPAAGQPDAEQTAAEQAAMEQTTAEEPSWIEIGSPKRRTAPPAWSDEAAGDAWVATEQSSHAVELEEQRVPEAGAEAEAEVAAGAEADAEAEAQVVADAETEAGADADAALAVGDPSEAPPTVQPDVEDEGETRETPALQGFRLRKAPESPSPRPFRRPAARDAVHSGADAETDEAPAVGDDAQVDAPPAEPAPRADDWVQGPVPSAEEPKEPTEPTGPTEPTASTESAAPTESLEVSEFDATEPTAIPFESPAEPEALEEQAPEDSSDPESGERWQVVRDGEQPPIQEPEPDTVRLDAEQDSAVPLGAEPEPDSVPLAAEQDLAATSSPAATPSPDTEPSAAASSSADRSAPAPAAPTRPRAFPVPGFPVPMRPEASTADIGPRPTGTDSASSHPVGTDSTGSGPADSWPATRRSATAETERHAPGREHRPSEHEAGSEAEPEAELEPGRGTESEQGRRSEGGLRRALELLGPHLQDQRPALVLGLVTLVLSIWMLVALPFPLKYSIDAALAVAGVGSTASGSTGADPSAALLTAAGILAGLVALQAGFRALSASVLNRTGGRAATDLRGRLLGHLHRLSPGRDHEDSARTSDPLVDDIGRLRDLVADVGPRLLGGLLALASLLVVVLVVEPIAAAVVALTAGLIALTTAWTLRRERRTAAAASADEAALAETADELLAATRTIQSYGLEQRSERSLGTLGTRAARSRATARGARAVGGFLTQLIAGLGVGAALMLSGGRMAAGTMTPGELTMVIVYVLLAGVLARDVVRHADALPPTRLAADRVGELLERRAEITEPRRTQSIDHLRGEVVYSALSTTGAHGVLFDRISLVIPAGQHVALVGREGVEASALLSYLQRFDQPDTGRVLLDRFDTRVLAVADLRRRLAVVQREAALFTETVRENIRVGRPEASDEEILQAARRSGADEFITLLPDGYDTLLTRRGAGLSDGQRRRIAIARALLRDAPVVVLDGADEDLTRSERDDVRRALDVLAEGRTTLISSRDPETILAADRVLCFESGDLAEDGAPAPLAADPDSWLATWLHAADLASR